MLLQYADGLNFLINLVPIILTPARLRASERRSPRRVRRSRRLRGCPHRHRVHLDANLGARVRHLVGYFGSWTQPHRAHLA